MRYDWQIGKSRLPLDLAIQREHHTLSTRRRMVARMDGTFKLKLPDEYDEGRIINELGVHDFVRREESAVAAFVFYDTFDWRLFNESLVLYTSGSCLTLCRLPELGIVQRAEITAPPIFAWELPAGELKTSLSPIIEMRALMQLAEIHLQSTAYRMLNRDGKTVVRFAYEELRPAHPANAPMLSAYLGLEPVKGYRKNYRRLVNQLEKVGCTQVEAEEIYFKALGAANKKPGDYSSKLKLQLDPDMRAAEATKIILRFLSGVIKGNEEGVKADRDTEFVHDFRVAIRRTRSALTQIKSVFPPETTERFREDFSFLSTLTNPLRDLDVYLLKENDYKSLLPQTLRDDIEPLFDLLGEKRAKALADVVDGLNSEHYSEILNDWETFLNQPPQNSSAAANAESPVIDLARRRIYKKYRRIVKTGGQILENAQDESLHALRIECKKLRYLIEFFSSLFPDNEISTLIKQLKRLQDNLGDFNDLRVQKEYLQHTAEELPTIDPQSGSTILAMGRLIATLDEESQHVKDSFSEVFTDFASPSNRRSYKELFSTSNLEKV